MKICSYSNSGPLGKITRLGILKNNNLIIDPNTCFKLWYELEGRYNPTERANYKLPSSLSQILEFCDHPIQLLQEALDLYDRLEEKGIPISKDGQRLSHYLNSDIKLEKPLDKIKTYRDFFIHEKHVKTGFSKRGEEIPKEWYEMPVYYKGATAGFIGPEDEILWPSYTEKLDYELELGLVIGKDGINIKENQALKHVFGLTILNDISARDIQKKEMAVRLGPAKGKDFCSIIGPVITTIDEFNGSDPDLLMLARVNGQEWSRGRSGDASFSWGEIISHASKEEWILAGDFLGSGTVGTGCGLELDRWISPGDLIELEIENIGILKNRVGHRRIEDTNV